MAENNDPTRAAQKITVEIFGDIYSLKTDSDPEYVKNLAYMVDRHMKNVAKRTRTFQSNRISVLAALEIADEYLKLKKDYDDLLALLEEK